MPKIFFVHFPVLLGVVGLLAFEGRLRAFVGSAISFVPKNSHSNCQIGANNYTNITRLQQSHVSGLKPATIRSTEQNLRYKQTNQQSHVFNRISNKSKQTDNHTYLIKFLIKTNE